MNSDVEKTKIIDRLTEARDIAGSLKQDLLVYLIENSLAEARHAFYGERAATVGNAEVFNNLPKQTDLP